MFEWFSNLNYVIQALIATIFTWGVTAIGASIVFLFKKVNKNIMDAMLGFAAGVMIAASFWSLLSPSIEMSESLGMNSWIVASIGFLLGGILLFAGDKIFDNKLKKTSKVKDSENNDNKFKRCLMLIFSITLHNIPEGLAVGIAFGSIAYNLEGATLASAIILAIGIGLQNFPEGSAVSLPLRREGLSRKKAFFFGQLSAIVEPIAGVIGAILVLRARYLLPYLLAFAAGAMIYVVIEELIPQSQSNKKKDLMALFTLIGFAVMMIMDVALG
ncbi:MAG: ZIP family metal transporter [Clostridium sp.]|nr:ZIP family metal transporter [Clostridium sp.]MCM1444416.1 ZIP family metal transporter [Candidatus Amulumruptor caecigallinarius]